jgi:uncharacterized protein
MTTAIGFAVFMLMDNVGLREFGVISSLCVLTTYVISIVMLPILYSFLPAPSDYQLKHLDRKFITGLIAFIEKAVFHHRKMIFGVVILLVIASLIGIWKMESRSFMVDNIPDNSEPKNDLRFFEKHFTGVMPLEIVVDTQKKKGTTKLQNLQKIEELEVALAQNQWISEPLSIITLVKASKQTFYNNDVQYYDLPNKREGAFIFKYLQKGNDSTSQKLLKSLVDSTGQSMRISLKMADIGSQRMDSLLENFIKPTIQKTFQGTPLKAEITGTTRIFLKGNDYLITNLKQSILLAICLVGITMAFLFGSFKVILISVVTNLIPLAITAGLMGYLGIPLKPSTALIFSIVFGIAVDDAIHYLARYRQSLLTDKLSVPEAVRTALRETGAGMAYTSIVLFFGFSVFALSEFDGTKALGYLSASTLLCAMFSNLILLPALLLAFDGGKYDKNAPHLIEFYDESEKDDEEEEKVKT